jgi:selenocysteine-specific elongation factor
MNVERVFAVKGYGTVVTGIPVSGKVGLGEAVELLPQGQALMVRTVQSYKQEAQEAVASCCCAINVRDIEPSLVTRGQTLAVPAVYRPTTEIIVSLRNTMDDVALKRRFTVKLHSGTAAVDASVKLLDGEEVVPGGEAFAHLILTEPLTLAAGDRFLIRQNSPSLTLGGGMVLSVSAQRLRRHEEVGQRLQAAREAAVRGDYLMAELLAGPSAIVSAEDALRATQCTGETARQMLAGAVKEKRLADLTGAYLVVSRAAEVTARVRPMLEMYHRENPYTWGMTPNHVCEAVGIPVRAFSALTPYLASQGMVVKFGRLALNSFKPPISERLMGLRDRILKTIESAGVLGPARGDLMKEHAIAEADMKVLTKLLTGDGTVLMLDGNFLLRSVYEQCRGRLIELFGTREVVELADFREAIGGSRKLVVAMLDAFDAEGLTRRVAQGRVLARPAQAAAAKESAREMGNPGPTG